MTDFLKDFVFQLDQKDLENPAGRADGVLLAMLSGQRALQVHVAIMRTLVHLRPDGFAPGSCRRKN